MFDCSVEELNLYNRKCYVTKKMPTPAKKFDYRHFDNLNDAIDTLKFIFVPMRHGDLPFVSWELLEKNTLVVKTVAFYNFEDQYLYQNSVERAWALGGHLDPRVQQFFYD